MRRLLMTVTLLALPLAACAGTPTTTGLGSGVGPPVTSSSAPDPGPVEEPGDPGAVDPGAGDPGAISLPFPGRPEDYVDVPAGQLDATALPQGWQQAAWTDPAGTGLGLFGQSSGCYTSEAELLGEDATTIAVQVRKVVTSQGPCTEELGYPALQVPLAQPLGTRTVVLTYAEVTA